MYSRRIMLPRASRRLFYNMTSIPHQVQLSSLCSLFSACVKAGQRAGLLGRQRFLCPKLISEWSSVRGTGRCCSFLELGRNVSRLRHCSAMLFIRQSGNRSSPEPRRPLYSAHHCFLLFLRVLVH